MEERYVEKDLMKKLKFISYGESLVDFLPGSRGKLRNVSSFTKSLGGAPTNQAVGLARLEENISLLGVVGEDEFGYFIKEALTREGVDSTYVRTTSLAKTGVTFITLNEQGDRSFFFFREPSADQTLRKEDIPMDVFEGKDVLSIGTNLLTKEPVRSATFHVANLAKGFGLDLAIDVNYRAHLWEDPSFAEKEIHALLKKCTLIKVNEEEFAFLSKGKSEEALFEQFSKHHCRALVITKAQEGAKVITKNFSLSAPAPPTDVVDTTGAGDGFIAGLLSSISHFGEGGLDTRIQEMEEEDWKKVLSFACTVGSLVCTKLGATPGLPFRKDIY